MRGEILEVKKTQIQFGGILFRMCQLLTQPNCMFSENVQKPSSEGKRGQKRPNLPAVVTGPPLLMEAKTVRQR